MSDDSVETLEEKTEVFVEDSGNISYPQLVNLNDVVKVYESPSGRYTALKGIDLQVSEGEFIAVVGKSGSGKSTLMNMITGIDRPTSGEVFVNDVGIHQLSEGKVAVWRGRTIGIVFQFFQLLPTLTVIENVMLPMDFCHMFTQRERVDRAKFLLNQVELDDQAYKLPSTLSGGQQQRVAIARALANDPPMIVADEPTGNLDTKTAESIFSLFEELVRNGKTIIMVTHDQDMAKKVSRTIYLLDGRIVERDEFQTDRDTDEIRKSVDAATETIELQDPYDEALNEFRLQISEILDDPENVSARLKIEIIDQIPTEDGVEEVYYKVLLDEVSYRAKLEEEMGRTRYAELLWKALAEATE